MHSFVQSSQRSTCPPSAAVRQVPIADMTFSWPRLTPIRFSIGSNKGAFDPTNGERGDSSKHDRRTWRPLWRRDHEVRGPTSAKALVFDLF